MIHTSSTTYKQYKFPAQIFFRLQYLLLARTYT